MDKARIIELRETAERRCADLYSQVTSLQTELERTRGEYRAYDALLSNWPAAEPQASKEAKKGKEKQ